MCVCVCVCVCVCARAHVCMHANAHARMSVTVPLLPHIPSWCVQGQLYLDLARSWPYYNCFSCQVICNIWNIFFMQKNMYLWLPISGLSCLCISRWVSFILFWSSCSLCSTWLILLLPENKILYIYIFFRVCCTAYLKGSIVSVECKMAVLN